MEAIVQDGRITGIITESKSGRQVIRADRVVDATGDADVAYLAGCPYTTLPAKDRMSVTQVFNVPGSIPNGSPNTTKPILKLIRPETVVGSNILPEKNHICRLPT